MANKHWTLVTHVHCGALGTCFIFMYILPLVAFLYMCTALWFLLAYYCCDVIKCELRHCNVA